MTAQAASTVAWLNSEKYTEPVARDEMDPAAFDAMMRKSLEQARAGQGVSLKEAFEVLRGSLQDGIY